MTRKTLSVRVGSDGVLHVPLGAAEADREVRVTIESLAAPCESEAEYIAWVDRMAGRWKGEFERMPQGEIKPRAEYKRWNLN